MTDIEVELFDPRFRSFYPTRTLIVSDRLGYFVHKQIPMLFRVQEDAEIPYSPFSKSLPPREVLQAAILFEHKAFPRFVFPVHSSAYIHLNGDVKYTSETLIQKVTWILDGTERIPLLYDLWKHPEVSDVPAKIKEIRDGREYFDLFHASQIPLSDYVNQLSTSFEITDLELDVGKIQSFYNQISEAPRYIHISLHYLINAARLIPNFFTEEAGINLNLASEAIIKDHMEVMNIQNKKLAIQSLLAEHLHFSADKIDWLIELYEARNEYLAHIDSDMFTNFQNTAEPDRYCYDHYEDICDLIIEYMKIRKNSTP